MRTVRSAAIAENFIRLGRRAPRRHALRADPRTFGRGPIRTDAEPIVDRRWTISEEVALFATTFAAGFIFVTIFIA